VKSLKKHMRYKARLFPERYRLEELPGFRRIATVRDFDNVVTAHFCGFEDAADYYARSSARGVMSQIRRPTLIMIAQDDPFVPFGPFRDAAIAGNSFITLVAPEHGGHCAFISQEAGPNRFWAEAKIVEFCVKQSKMGEQEKTAQATGVSSEG